MPEYTYVWNASICILFMRNAYEARPKIGDVATCLSATEVCCLTPVGDTVFFDPPQPKKGVYVLQYYIAVLPKKDFSSQPQTDDFFTPSD